MSVESLAACLHHSRAKGTAKLVLLGIANHDGDGGAWPSVATLATYANADRSTVQRAISRLVELGELVVERQQGGTAGMPDELRPNLYRVLVSCPESCDGTSSHRDRRAQLSLLVANPVDNRAAAARPGPPSERGGGRASAAGGGRAGAALTIPKNHPSREVPASLTTAREPAVDEDNPVATSTVARARLADAQMRRGHVDPERNARGLAAVRAALSSRAPAFLDAGDPQDTQRPVPPSPTPAIPEVGAYATDVYDEPDPPPSS